jgi:hypothetical protein
MSINERFSIIKSFSEVRAPSEEVLLAVIAAAFLILHIVAGSILIDAFGPAATTTQQEAQEARASLYD